MDEELRRAWNELQEGRIAYDPNPKMTQGNAEEITTRITAESRADILSGLNGKPWVERLKVSGSMSAYLEGDPEEFEIHAINSNTQAIVGPYTAWEWSVTPLKSGECNLNLRVVAKVRLSSKETEEHDVVVKRARIIVKVAPLWVSKRFVSNYWQWLVGSPLALLLGWLVVKRKAWFGRPRKIGF